MVGLGIIGFGVMGRRLAEAAAKHSLFEVICAYEPNTAADWNSTVSRAARPEDVIGHRAVDCVYIASPPGSHLQWVRAVAGAGKALLCEKPLAATTSDSWAAVDAVTAARVPAAVNFPFATAPAARSLVELVHGGLLGGIQSAELKLRFSEWPRAWQSDAGSWLRNPAEGGFTREVASHFLFLTQRMFGPGTVRSAEMRRGGRTEVELRAEVAYSSVTLNIDAAVDGSVADYNRLTVAGDAGEAALFDWYNLEIRGEITRWESPIMSQLDELATMLQTPEQHRLSTFGEAASVVELVEQLLNEPKKHLNYAPRPA